MEATLWGTRGSLPVPGPETQRYGGNTSCVEVRGWGGPGAYPQHRQQDPAAGRPAARHAVHVDSL